MLEFGLTARQFNAVRMTLDGLERSYRQRLPELIEEDRTRLRSAKRRWKIVGAALRTGVPIVVEKFNFAQEEGTPARGWRSLRADALVVCLSTLHPDALRASARCGNRRALRQSRILLVDRPAQVFAPVRHQRSSGCGTGLSTPRTKVFRATKPPGSGRPWFSCKEERKARLVLLGDHRSGRSERWTLRTVALQTKASARSVGGCGCRRDHTVRRRWDSGARIRRQRCSGGVRGIWNTDANAMRNGSLLWSNDGARAPSSANRFGGRKSYGDAPTFVQSKTSTATVAPLVYVSVPGGIRMKPSASLAVRVKAEH